MRFRSSENDGAGLIVAFAAAGHAFFHVLVGLYAVIVLALPAAWGLAYDQLITLWAWGAALIGFGAPVAGWLGDRVGPGPMMVVFFLGAGAAALLCGLAPGPAALQAGLIGLGLFGAIYHPVGLSWVVGAVAPGRRGRVLGLVGWFGSIGVALVGIVGGGLIWLQGWRLAFILPGAIAVGAGILLAGLLLSGRFRVAGGGAAVADDTADSVEAEATPGTSVLIRAGLVLAFTMFAGGVLFESLGTVLPKWYEQTIAADLGGGILGLGAIVSATWGLASVSQLAGGWLADRLSARSVFAFSFGIKGMALLVATQASGLSVPLVGLAILVALELSGPAENVLVARYSPKRNRGLFYGLKYILGFGAAPVGVALIAVAYGRFDGHVWLFGVLALLCAVMCGLALLLPTERRGLSRAAG